MNYTGIVIGTLTFLIIGIFHPLVIWAEYNFTKNIWPVSALVGVVFIVLSLFSSSVFVSCIFAVFAASSLWSIRELFQQEKRVEKGWFPKKNK